MAEWGKVNHQRKTEGKEEQTLEDWRKAKKGPCAVMCLTRPQEMRRDYHAMVLCICVG